MKKLLIFSSILLIMALTACSKAPEKELGDNFVDGPAPDTLTNKTETMPKFNQTAKPEKGEQIVVMKTNMGTIKIRLFPGKAPKTVENFLGLINKKYYDGIIFHRVIPDFMIQGGDPTGTGMGGESIWGGKFEDEFNADIKNIRGALSMANSGPNTNGSQFFIVQASATPWLDGHHTVFGQVFEGLDIVDKIISVDRDASDKPLKKVVMQSVTTGTY